MTIGESIRQVREERGYSRERLARQIGVHRMTILKWEYGVSKANIESIIAIADVLRVSLDELVGRRVKDGGS